MLLCGTWDLLRPGIEAMSPALAARFFTSEPPGRPSRAFTFAFFSRSLTCHCYFHQATCAWGHPCPNTPRRCPILSAPFSTPHEKSYRNERVYDHILGTTLYSPEVAGCVGGVVFENCSASLLVTYLSAIHHTTASTTPACHSF